ncbi:MAG: DUF5654 family protein [Candidatus Micrarchaeota archaeon]
MEGMKQEIKAAKQEVKEAKEEIIEAKEELKEAKQEMKEARAEMKKATADRLSLAREAGKEIRARVLTVITTALALVAALFWQTAINDTIKTFIPVSGAWQYEIGVALSVTLIAALAIFLLTKSLGDHGK